MARNLACTVIVAAVVACGSRTSGTEPVEEPASADPDPADPAPADPEPVEGSDAGEPAPADPGLEEGPPAAPQAVEGSASGTEVKPMQVKDFDVSTEVDFDPSPAKDKKAPAIEKIGMATAGTADCYIDLLTKQPELEGTIEITFTITPAGAAKAVKASGSTGSAPLEKCAIKSFKGKKFPKKLAGAKPVQAVVTITLRPYK